MQLGSAHVVPIYSGTSTLVYVLVLTFSPASIESQAFLFLPLFGALMVGSSSTIHSAVSSKGSIPGVLGAKLALKQGKSDVKTQFLTFDLAI